MTYHKIKTILVIFSPLLVSILAGIVDGIQTFQVSYHVEQSLLIVLIPNMT